MTDENAAYTKLGKEFAGHGTVNRSADEYVRLGGFVHVNSAENYFSIFKRGVLGQVSQELDQVGTANATQIRQDEDPRIREMCQPEEDPDAKCCRDNHYNLKSKHVYQPMKLGTMLYLSLSF